MNNNYGPAPEALGFGGAIATCFKKYFIFEGRASQSEFWYFFLVYTVGGFILDAVAYSQDSSLLILISIAQIIVGFFPMLAVGCRRLHDINKSGWWQLIPIYNLILWTLDSSSGTTKKRSNLKKSKNLDEVSEADYGTNDITDELEELQELYEDGTLSEAQFKKAKNKLLK
tara:strand:+ start:78 stop:590 length:513 start_codon:yes stop_codon:yes gene_type:complete